MATSRRAGATLITLVLGAGLLAGAPAQAGAPSTARHCVVVLDAAPATGRQTAAAARRPPAHCFATFTKAQGWASGGRAGGGARAPRIRSTRVLAVLHEHADFGGASLTLAGGIRCGRGSVARYDLTGLFDGETSAAEARSGCHRLLLFDNADATGSFVACAPSCSWVGDRMNDRASAVIVKG
jgi:hypothetical protein